MKQNRNLLVSFLVAIFLLNGIGLYLWQRRQQTVDSPHSAVHTARYHCPMHPDVVADEPGKCPVCKMDLVPFENESAPQSKAEAKILFYRHPMQPEITSPVPAKDSMGMDYIAVYAEPQSAASDVSGRAGFSLSPDGQQRIGVTSARVSRQALTQEIFATGRVAFDPELYAAIEEYRQAVIASQQLKNSRYNGFIEQSQALVKSSETKLKLLGLTEGQIRGLAKGGARSLNLILPEGRVWVYAEVFEYEIGGIKAGQRIEAEAPSIPGVIFKGVIASISPVLNAPTRTIRVRSEVPDPKGLLRPDTYLNVRMINDLGPKLAVPDDAVLRTGAQSYVFVKDENNFFVPRAVQLGIRAKGFVEVIGGLKAGEEVITGANFLLDSESRLKSVLGDKSSPVPAMQPAAGAGHD